MKKNLSMLIVVIILAVMFIPGWGNVDAAAEPVNMKVNIFGGEKHKKTVTNVLKQMEETSPNINADVIITPWGDYIQKLSILSLTGEAPDVAWAADVHLKAFMENDLLVDISEIMTDGDETYDFDDFIPETMDFLRKDGKLYGIPFSTPPKFIMYNEDMFAEAGLKTPYEMWKQGKWNYETFTDAIVKITDKDNGVYGYTSIIPSDVIMCTIDILWGYGAEVFNEDGTEFLLNSPEGEEALQIVWDLYNKYDVLPDPGQMINFNSGKVGMKKAGISDLNSVGGVDFNWNIAPLPEGPAHGPIQMGYAAYVVMNDRQAKEDIIALIKGLTSKEACLTMSEFFVAPRASVLESEELADQYPVDNERFSEVVLGSLEKGKVLETPKNFANMKTVFQAAFEKMIIEDISVEETLDIIEDDIQEFLN